MNRCARRGPAARRLASLQRLGRELGGRHDPVHEAEPLRLVHVDAVAQQVELARLGRADQLGQQVRAAVIARQADLHERGAHDRGLGGDAHVAGQRDRQAGAGRAPGRAAMRRLGHLEQAERGAPLQLALGSMRAQLVDRCARARRRAMFFTSPPAQNAPARAGQQHATDLAVELRGSQLLGRPLLHLRVSALRCSGRLKVSTRTPSSRRTNKSLVSTIFSLLF